MTSNHKKSLQVPRILIASSYKSEFYYEIYCFKKKKKCCFNAI